MENIDKIENQNDSARPTKHCIEILFCREWNLNCLNYTINQCDFSHSLRLVLFDCWQLIFIFVFLQTSFYSLFFPPYFVSNNQIKKLWKNDEVEVQWQWNVFLVSFENGKLSIESNAARSRTDVITFLFKYSLR